MQSCPGARQIRFPLISNENLIGNPAKSALGQPEQISVDFQSGFDRNTVKICLGLARADFLWFPIGMWLNINRNPTSGSPFRSGAKRGGQPACQIQKPGFSCFWIMPLPYNGFVCSCCCIHNSHTNKITSHTYKTWTILKLHLNTHKMVWILFKTNDNQ